MSHTAFLMVNIWLEYEPDLTKRTENPSFFGQEILFLTGLITYIFYSRYSLKYMASIGVGAEKYVQDLYRNLL